MKKNICSRIRKNDRQYITHICGFHTYKIHICVCVLLFYNKYFFLFQKHIKISLYKIKCLINFLQFIHMELKLILFPVKINLKTVVNDLKQVDPVLNR